jgi:hypothetical protein
MHDMEIAILAPRSRGIVDAGSGGLYGFAFVKRSSKFPCYRHEFAPYSRIKYLKILEVLTNNIIGN